MLGTCPRCGQSRPMTLENASSVPCPACGYSELVVSGFPPQMAETSVEPLWAPALMTCIAVSAIVFVLALLAARVAGASPVSTSPAHDDGCEAPEQMTCVDLASR